MRRWLLRGLLLSLWLGLPMIAQAAVELAWDYSIADEPSISGFHLWRSADCTEPFVQITTTPIAGGLRTYVDTAWNEAAAACWYLAAVRLETQQGQPSNVVEHLATYTPDWTTATGLHLPLDDTADPTADTSGSNHPADVSATGATWETTTMQWGAAALTMDGGGSATAAWLPTGATTVTLSAWVRWTADQRNMEVVSLGDVLGLRIEYAAGIYTAALFYRTATGVVFVRSTFPLTPSTWTHLAGTVEAGRQQLFIDGGVAATGTTAAAILWSGAGTSTVLGAHGNGEPGWGLTGTLDEVQVWTRILTPVDVAWQAVATGFAMPPLSCSILTPTSLPVYSTTTTAFGGVTGSTTATETVEGVAWACPQCQGGSQTGAAVNDNTWTAWHLPTLTLTADTIHTLTVTVTGEYGHTAPCALTITHQSITYPADAEAHWTFDEASGSAVDASGHGHLASLGTGVTRVAGHIGTGAVAFDGTSAARITSPGLMGMPPAITLATWFKLASVPQSIMELISMGDHVALRIEVGNILGFYYTGSNWIQLRTSWIPDTNWHHVAYAVTAGVQALYLDGVQIAAGTASQAINYTGLGLEVVLGQHGNGQGMILTGRLDDTHIYTRILTGSDILALMSGTSPPTCTITTPDTSPYPTEETPLVLLAGTGDDDSGVTAVAWSNNRGGGGIATGQASWSVANIALKAGINLLTVTVQDAGGLSGTCALSVTYTPQATPETSAGYPASGTGFWDAGGRR